MDFIIVWINENIFYVFAQMWQLILPFFLILLEIISVLSFIFYFVLHSAKLIKQNSKKCARQKYVCWDTIINHSFYIRNAVLWVLISHLACSLKVLVTPFINQRRTIPGYCHICVQMERKHSFRYYYIH